MPPLRIFFWLLRRRYLGARCRELLNILGIMWALGKLGRCCSHQALIMQCWGIGVFGNLGFGIEGLGDWGISARFRRLPPVFARFCPFLPVSARFHLLSPVSARFHLFLPISVCFHLFLSIRSISLHIRPFPSMLGIGGSGKMEIGGLRIGGWGIGEVKDSQMGPAQPGLLILFLKDSHC